MKRKNNPNFAINRARYNILFMIFLSIINAYFVLSQGIIKIPFSSSLSTYSAVFSKAVANQSGDESFCRVGILLSAIVLGVYFMCYLLSKKNPRFLFIGFVIFVFDTVFLVATTFILTQINLLTVFDILLHVFTLYMLYSAVIFNKKTPIDKKAVAQEPETESDYEEITLRYQNNGNEPIINAAINDFDIKIHIDQGQAVLVVNGFICAQKEYDINSYFELYAVINDIELSFISRKDREYLLFANKELLKKIIK